MAKVGTSKRIFVGVGIFIVTGIIGSTFSSDYLQKGGVSNDITINIPAETQKAVETSLVGDKKEMTFIVDGQLVYAQRR